MVKQIEVSHQKAHQDARKQIGMVSLTDMVISDIGARLELQKRYCNISPCDAIHLFYYFADTLQWIDNTVVPHFNAVKIKKNLPPTQKACLTIDMWPIHTAKTDDDCFLPWIKEKYPWLATVFIPGGCESCSSQLMLFRS